MSQDEVVKILEKEDRPLTAREIHEKSDLSIASIINNLNRLCKHSEVIFIKEKLKGFITIKRYTIRKCD